MGVGAPHPRKGRTPTVCPAPRQVLWLYSRRPPEIACSKVELSPYFTDEEKPYGRPRPSCQSTICVLFSVVDLVSTDLEEVALKCGLSYKVS